MKLWFRVRSGDRIIGSVGASILLLITPVSAFAATPSPGGATIALALVVGLIVPVVAAWGCGRGDQLLEWVSVRRIRIDDLLLVTGAVGAICVLAVALSTAGLAPAGRVAARSAIVFLGLSLAAQPIGGWRLSAVAPATYLLAVAIVGRGEDVNHPAAWAWVAAPDSEPSTWVLTAAVLLVGTILYLVIPPTTPSTAPD